MRPVRIALVVPEFRPDVAPGGLTTVVEFFVRCLSRPDFAFEIISVASSSKDPSSRRIARPQTWFRRSLRVQKEHAGVSFMHFGANGVELETQRYRPRRELTRYLDQFDVVQLIAGSPAFAQVAGRVGRPVSLLVATMVKWEREALLARGGGVRSQLRTLMTRRVSSLDESGLDHPDRVFVLNQAMLAEVNRLGHAAVLAPPGIDTDWFVSGERVLDPPYVLCVGRLDDPRKHIALLIEAFAELRQTVPCELVLAGPTGPTAADLQRIEELGLRGAVRIRTAVSRAELRSLYQGASCFALPSKEEGLGLVLVEAMACGVPVVAMRTAGTGYILSDPQCGLLVEQGDDAARDLAAALGLVLTDAAQWEELSRRGRQHAVDHFSVRAAESVFLETYRELVACE